uniref:HYDIN axonemal central pair apparatus protein n=1 Tax=Mastacembelus armatus TaxID=205130 RepID=A0A3Q3MLA1_9TELE
MHLKTNKKYMDRALFQPYPSELVFQNFTPAETYKLPLVLINIDKVSRQVKLELRDSEYFHVVGPDEPGSKVAPGMTATFTVLFTPQENKDYHHRLICVTERERFEVPVFAIGPRAILDFRDEISLPLCAVKASTQRTHLVRNIGNSKAKFKLQTERPFSVMPSSGTLDVGESMQVTVTFNPMTIGDHNKDLLLHYHTGEDVYISLYGACEELNIHLEPDSVLLKKTYISLANVHTVSLTNRSDIPLQFCWSAWSSQEDQDLSLLQESSVLLQNEAKERLLYQRESNPTAIHHLLDRALEEHRGQAANDHLLALSHSCITVEPVEGEIWPNTTAHFNIVFKPEQAKLYQRTIYCDVAGRESRLPLTIKGEGIGPKLQLNYNLMDVKNVFIGDKNCYEVLLSNRGLIDAPFKLSSPDTTFGRCFTFSPEEGVVPSGACQIVEVTFHSCILGTFSEDFLLSVTGQPQPLTLTFRGCVIGPTFHFNVSELNFGDVAFGFPLTLICTLFNTSWVPMTFALRVLGDGLGSPSVTSAKQASDMSRNNWQGNAARDLQGQPMEFTVSPAAGSVRAMSDVAIKVTLCSNTVRQYREALVVDVKGVGEEIMTLPINARCIVPEIIVETPVLDFQRCFLDYPYHQQVRLTNPSSLPACYGLLDQEYEESPSLLFGSSMPRGVILPHSSEELPVFLLAKAIGRLCHSLHIAVFGSVQPSLVSGSVCIPQLDFGRIPVLTDVTKTLHLSNQSPVSAHFTAHMSNRRSFWHIEPSEGVIPPQSQLELRVVANLKDTLPFQDRLEVSVQDSQTHTVSLSATGTGTTIVSDMPFAPSIDLGTYFSHESCQYHFKLTNYGQRLHRMYWGIDGFLPSTKTRKRDSLSGRTFLPPISTPRKKDVLGHGSFPSSSREKPVFSLSPSRVELFPGCSVDMVLTGSSDSPRVVREHLVCHGIVGHEHKQQIMSVDVTCRFIAPVLSISSKHLTFYIEKIPGTSLMPLYEKLVLENVSSLPLSMKLSLVEPFYLCEAPGDHSSSTSKSMVLGDGKQAALWVCFNPSYCQDQMSQVIDKVRFLEIHYQGHSKQDMVELHAEVHFPSLHFSSTTVDFGCVLNCTETHKVIMVTNCSPLPVSYHWAFLEEKKHCIIRYIYTENVTHIHYTCVYRLFDHVGEGEVTLRNTGKVGFKFTIIHPQWEEEGYIDAGAEQCLHVLYLPGVPEMFEKRFQLQLAFLPPLDITLMGEGVFPRINLNLPRYLRMHKHYEELLHMEIERLLVKESALTVTSEALRDSQGSSRKWHKLSKLLLPEYVLDFGFAIPGKVLSHTVHVTNSGLVPVSFHANHKPLTGTGFSAEFERVKNLPCGETQTFTLKFDPQGAKLHMKDISVIMPIQVHISIYKHVHYICTSGPTVQLRLCVVTIQLLNQESVPCYWSIVDKFLPLHQRKKVLQEQRPPPVVFEVIPSSGMLSPGDQVYVQIKFIPPEGHAYNRKLVVRVSKSTQQIFITVQGQGEEPQLEFCPSVLELGPCLPTSTEVQADVTVKNPCSFPIEFYCLEFDTQYLEEEKILRLMQDYDENNILFLPPRAPGESLPAELLDYYEEYCSQLKDNGSYTHLSHNRWNFKRQGQLEMTPVSRAIARHMCIDLSSESLAAHTPRGIAIIVYGGPQTAAALAEHYGGACLSVDAIVTDVLMNGTSPVSLTARQLYNHGLAKYNEKKTKEAGKHNISCLCIVVYCSQAFVFQEDVTTFSSLLPEQLLAEILAERFQLSDCQRGVIIDGLESSYTQSVESTLQVVLKALKNRKHIYVVTLADSCTYHFLCFLPKCSPSLGLSSFPDLFPSLLWYPQVLDDLGLGSRPPPIPPSIIFSMVPFPKTREPSNRQPTCKCFTFLVPSLSDEQFEEKKDSEEDVQASAARVMVILKIWFYSDSPGTFEQTFNFELLGTQKLYQLICRGVCIYPSICSDYKSVQHMEEGLQKTYIIDPGYFEFGPLLCSKTRDRYKENKYPDNTERLVIHNNSGLEADIQFRFQHDTHATTYLLDPPTMTLKPDQKQELRVWAYPTKLGQILDSVVCRIKNNSQPVIIKISCWGVRPELELESKLLQFHRVLLLRQDSRSVMMHNRTALPVSWALQGVEELGDEFSVPQDKGIISPNSSFPLSLHFMGKRPLHIKRILRLEVSDEKNILGIVHTENIQVSAEAYDIALDISPDGCLDFGTIRVFEEAKMSLKMKNQGKYEIQTDPSQPNLDSIFTVSPQHGTLMPFEKPTTVQVVCKPNKEVFIREQPILPCQITPACDINFGPLVYGCKKSQSFTIENIGVFETRFTVCMSTDAVLLGRPGWENRTHTLTCTSYTKENRLEPFQNFSHNNRLTTGVFSVSPCTGSLQPGSQQVVTVECVAEQLGKWDQSLLIEISDRDPSVHPEGIPYRLLAEVCKPALDMASIFEEHHLCHNSRQLSSEQFCNAEGIYVLDENKFIFNKVIVGQTAKARLKFTNNKKVPCVISCISLQMSRNVEIFDLSPTTLSIHSQSHSFAVVSFTPQTMQLYSAVLEVTMEGTSRYMIFDLMGEGNLPSVSVVRPALRNTRENPVLRFRRVLVGRRRTLPLMLLNDGNVPAQVQIDMLDKHGVFTLKPAPGYTCSSIYCTKLEEHQLVHRAILTLNVSEQVEFEVSFCSDKPLIVKAKMSLQVEDNQYSNTIIQVTGEAYQEIVSIDNISQSEVREVEKGERDHKVGMGRKIGANFTLINHSSSQVVRFEWPPPGPHILFSPQVGHLHAGCSKEMTVTFSSSQPVTLSSQPMRCKISQVEFQLPLEQVADWDDRQRTVQWLSSSQQSLDTQPVKNKVIKIDPEPSCSVVEGSQWELELRISAICDYVNFSCSTNTILFKDTMLYQTRVHQFQIQNQGSVRLEFSWQVFMDQRSSTVNNDQEGNTEILLHSITSIYNFECQCVLHKNNDMDIVKLCLYVYISFSIPNLKDGDQAPCISVCGRSLLPQCHFDLDDSAYINENRHNPEFRSPLDPNTRVIEFNSTGVSVPSTRSFSVLNPTRTPYSFKWKCEDSGGSPFHCLTQCGTILPGKKVEMCFEYVPEQLEVVESSWSFVIETQSLSVPFLCVGNSREPCVYLTKPHLDLGDLLVGRKVEQTVDLVNGESEAFQFSVLETSLLCEDQQSSLILQPMTGTVPPKDRQLLSVSFTPCWDGYVTFRLVLRVKRKSEPLTLTIKANCFTMSTLVHVENPDGVTFLMQSAFNFLVSNVARFNLEVSFDVTGPSELLQHIKAKPQNATIEVEKQLKWSLFFCPRSICNLQEVRLSIKVKHGPTFSFAIKGKAVAPSLEFSFTKFNFGKCFLYCPDMVPASQTLEIRNKGERDISVQCQFRNTSYLEMKFHPDILSTGAVMKVPVTFYPREACRYHEKLIFILNSYVTKQVDILGQGIEVKLELEDPKQSKVKLGTLMLGQKVKRQVVVVNRSALDLSFTLSSPFLSSAVLNLLFQDLTFSPAGQQNLKARGGCCTIEIQFSPRQHIPPFTAELQAEFAGLLHPLLTIEGCCQGVEVMLDQDHLAFGAVVQRCQARKKIVMMNTGDIGARFHWKTKHFPPELSISPATGYICPGMEVPFELTFAPVELSNDTKYENLACLVEGSSSPITLTVTGSCIVASTSKEVVNFVCPVRGSHTQSLPVVNPSNQCCSIRPVIEGQQWSGAPSMTLEPLQQKTYEITYRPLTMTTDRKKHLGSVFFSFPDGTGVLYSLQGTADPPKAADTIVCELPAKTQHTELLPVHNWLSKQQRFRVLIELLKPDATVSLKGLEYIDVPAQAKRDYRISVFMYKEGQYNTKVTFQNKVTGEYLFYLMTFKATSPGVLSTIELVTTVRRTVSATVAVENPLTTATCLITECKCTDISAPPQHIVPGQSKSTLSIEYQPLRAGESTARLTLSSNDLGFFHYDLLLRALPSPPEKTVHFNTSLGSSHSVLVRFINYSHFKTEYSCKIDCLDFIVDKSVAASPGFQTGSEASVEVCFEPHQLGEVRGQLSLSSGTGGEYIFPLHGVCLPPKAQGPFSIRAGRNITIPFKNVFLQTTAFSFQVDNPCFTVKVVDTILSKKTHNILVSFEMPAGGSLGPWFGKLTISSQRSEGHCKPCSWVYYLKGYSRD